MSFSHLDIATLASWLDESRAVTLVDIRDPMSFASGHLPGSTRLDNLNLGDFLDQADKAAALVVICYHGNSSQGAAGWLSSQGFAEVHSLDGGFTAWQAEYPDRVAS
ncbi:thiosulfate sulfurtransferase GlpE [Halotalea alkalilenta]|uniref:thiosulfate sulfurtransferase GlpE n=1 Tax=Halotalea alkalilenta TaxID=376489 RepID=UPI0004800A38|nr:thiosulfate sulfurtransferase GlpE [Halotalea alkalilenta]